MSNSPEGDITVSQLLKLLEREGLEGRGDYTVSCGGEYTLQVRTDTERPTVHENVKNIDFEGVY